MNQRLYKAFIEKDASYFGKYYVAVKSTGIYCNMNCPCKKPLYDNTSFYTQIEECLARGYRECKVCHPISSLLDDNNGEEYVKWLEKEPFPDKSYRQHPIPSIEVLNKIRVSFQNNVGISLGKYIRVRRVGYILNKDKKHASNPNKISFGFINSPLGEMVACFTEKGLHLLEFIDRRSLETELYKLKKTLKGYFVLNESDIYDKISKQISEYFDGQRKTFTIKLDPIGTAFQKQAWEGLSHIPYGEVVSYSRQAQRLNCPKAVRAVANANGKNMIAIIIPCHRVIASDGKMAGYGGGIDRKRKLLNLESKK